MTMTLLVLVVGMMMMMIAIAMSHVVHSIAEPSKLHLLWVWYV